MLSQSWTRRVLGTVPSAEV